MLTSLPSAGELPEEAVRIMPEAVASTNHSFSNDIDITTSTGLGSRPLGFSSDVSYMQPPQAEAAFAFATCQPAEPFPEVDGGAGKEEKRPEVASEGVGAHENGPPGAPEPNAHSPSEGKELEEGNHAAASVSPRSCFIREASKKAPCSESAISNQPLTARSWEFPMAAQEKWHRLILVYEKEAAMAEVQALKQEANEERLAELALSLKAENSRLRVQRRKLRAKLLRLRLGAQHLSTGQLYRSLGRWRRKGSSSCSAAEPFAGCEGVMLSQMQHQLQQHQRWFNKANEARRAKEVLVAREAAAVAERAWVRDQLTALWQENAGLRCRLEANVATTTAVATPGRSKASLCCCAC